MLAIPTIHLNGSNKANMLEDLANAREAILLAIVAVAETVPNGRDYFTQGRGALTQAQAEHRARIDALSGVMDELMALSVAIDAGGHGVVG
jgi:hypothetical protein